MPSRRALLALAATAAVGVVTTLSANAATPAAGHLGPSHKTLTWTTQVQYGSAFAVGGLEGVACPAASEDPADAVCDHYAMTVDVTASYWKSHHGGVTVAVPSGFYGYAYDATGKLAAAAPDRDQKVHTMLIPEPAGSYEIRLAPYLAFGTATVKASFAALPGAEKKLSGDRFMAYHGKQISRQPATKPQNTPIRWTGPKLSFKATYVNRGAAEPTIGVDRKGNAFFVASAFDALPKESPKNSAHTIILKSSDANRTWKSVQPPLVPGVGGDGQPVSLDPYVYVDPKTGRVFDIDLTLAGSYLNYSDDQGKTWTKGAAISVFGANDHQTLFAGPVPLGLTSIDPKYPRALYYCVNQIDGAWCARSLDGGKSFVNTGQPPFRSADTNYTEEHGAPVCGALHGHGVTDSKGRVFLPRGQCGRPILGISSDGGTTWQNVDILAEGTNIHMEFVQSSVAVDSADNLYYVWYDSKYRLPYLAISRDHGASWSKPRLIAPPGVQAVNFPSIDAGTPGRIAITFPATLSSDLDDISRPWFSYMVESVDALGSNPTFLSVVSNKGGLSDPTHRGDCSGRCGRMYDFLDVVVAPDAKGTVWATATDTCTALMSCSSKRVGGYSAASGEHGASDSRDGVVYRQVSGPSMWVGKRH